MAEYLFTYHKFPQLASCEEHEIFVSQMTRRKERENALITLGNFDRLTIAEVQSFARSRDFSSFSKSWSGDRLSLMLYDLEECNPLSSLGLCRNNSSSDGLCSFPKDSKYHFLALTFFSISDKLLPKSYDAYGILQKELCIKIRTFLENASSQEIENGRLRFSLMGTMGSAEYCVVWLSENYQTVLCAVEKLKAVQIQLNQVPDFLFSGFFSNFSLIRNDTDLKDIPSEVSILIGTKGITPPGVFSTAFQSELSPEDQETYKQCSLSFAAGEFDLILTGPAAFLISQIKEGGAFHFEHSFYQKYITHTHILLKESSSKKVPTGDFSWSLDIISEGNKISALMPRQLYKKADEIHQKLYGDGSHKGLRERLKEAFPPISCFIDDFDAFYHDLRSFLFSSAKLQRRLDCACRFEVVITIIECYLNDQDPKMKENILSIVKAFHFQLRQEREMSVPDPLDAPSCQGNFTGFQDLLLHCYNNFIKELLNWVRENSGKDMPLTTPLLTCSTVLQIKSIQFSATGSSVTPCLVNYELPTAIMTDLAFGLSSILHETFHYVPPLSREDRNILSACPILCEITLHCFCAQYIELAAAGKNLPPKDEEDAYYDLLNKLKASEEFKDFQIGILEVLCEAYGYQFHWENPNGFFSDFCTQFFRWLDNPIEMPIRKDPNDHRLFFAKSIEEAERAFGGLLNKALTARSNGQSYSLSKPSVPLSATFTELLKGNGSVFLRMIADGYGKLMQAYREVKADIGMLDVSGMSFADYLLCYSETALVSGEGFAYLSEAEGFRIMLVALYSEYCKNHTSSKTSVSVLESAADEFCYRYALRFLSKSYSSSTGAPSTKSSFGKYFSEAEQFVKLYKAVLQDMDEIFLPYRPFFSALFSLEDNPVQDGSEFVKRTQNYFKDLREAEREQYKKLPSGLYAKYNFSFLRIDTLRGSLETLQQKELERNQALIFQMQKTALLDELLRPNGGESCECS